MGRQKYQPKYNDTGRLIIRLMGNGVSEKLATELLSNIRFINNIDTPCWIRGNDSTIYTGIKVNNKLVKAHRLSYELFKGKKLIHKGCHHCDTPACINPDHIFDGTNKQNHEDAIEKNRKLSYSKIDQLHKEMKYNHDKIHLHEVDGVDRDWKKDKNDFVYEDVEKDLCF